MNYINKAKMKVKFWGSSDSNAVLVRDFLDADFYKELWKAVDFEIADVSQEGNNVRADKTLSQVKTAEWKQMLEYAMGVEFWSIMYGWLGLHRDVGKDRREALFSFNTPVEKESSVRSSHLDAGDKVCAGMLYLPALFDSAGGELVLFSDRDNYVVVPYEDNVFILFENNIAGWHFVSPRKQTDSFRRMMNIYTKTPDRSLYKHSYMKSSNKEIINPVYCVR